MSGVTIIDFGMGNLWSIKSALSYVGSQPSISSDPSVVSHSSALILPGVGSFKSGMDHLEKSGLAKAIINACTKNEIPILGICLGFQLLCNSSEEPTYTTGLSLLPLDIVSLGSKIKKTIALPHVGFNEVFSVSSDPLYKNIENGSDFYFVHSYGAFISPTSITSHSYCNYHEKIISSCGCNHIMGVQFHPEKSQTNGLILLSNFLKFANV